ncbi:MAG: aromatic acid exporter family protein [Sporomusaceae bacterium]|nr:aromatic acid exporter family protein [Sporomusaceae bacterium]
MTIGARTFKTGIAVTITMFICKLFDLEPAFFGAVSAVVNMQPTISLTFKIARDQVLVHVLGVAVGLGLGYLFGGNSLVMGLVTIIIIVLYQKFQFKTSLTAGVVAALFILSSSQEQFLAHAFSRTLVIFVGMGTAMLINILLMPPQYKEQFIAKLQISNELAVFCFGKAVEEYVRLQDQTPDYHQLQREHLQQHNKQTRDMFALMKREGGWLAPASEQHEWFALTERLLEYNEALAEGADRIYEQVASRYERRQNLDFPPLTDEFSAILEMLEGGCRTIARVNSKIKIAMLDGKLAEPEAINEDYWRQLMVTIEQWQSRSAGSYYLHTLLEAAVMANEIKWASRQAKKILQEAVRLNGTVKA